MKLRSSIAIFSLVLGAFVLNACGGGGGSSGLPANGAGGGGADTGGDTGAGGGTPVIGFSAAFLFDTGLGGSGGLIGGVAGFGSIFVNDLEMNTDGAAIFIEGAAGTESQLQEGHQVVVTGDLGTLTAHEVYYRANLKGPVSTVTIIDASIGQAELTVLGQTVRVNGATRYNGVTLEAIIVNDLLEVSGVIDSDGEVVASYLELKSALAEYKAIGLIANLNAATFDLGGLSVDHTGAVLVDFPDQMLEENQLVEVRFLSGAFTPPAAAVADKIELLPVPVISEGAEVEVEGFITQIASATEFSVSGLPVRITPTTLFEAGDAGGLAVNVKIEVEGVADAAGVIVADEVEFKFSKTIRAEGTVTAVDLAARTVDTMGVTFEIRDLSELEDKSSAPIDPLTLADLVINVDRVEIRGFQQNAALVAVELDREDPQVDGLLRGPVTAFDIAGTLEILGVTVVEQDGVTSYKDAAGGSVSRSQFFGLLEAGTLVEAKWTDFSGPGDIVESLGIEVEN